MATRSVRAASPDPLLAEITADRTAIRTHEQRTRKPAWAPDLLLTSSGHFANLSPPFHRDRTPRDSFSRRHVGLAVGEAAAPAVPSGRFTEAFLPRST